MIGTPEARFAARMTRAQLPRPPPRPAYSFRCPATPGSLAHLRRALREVLYSKGGGRIDVGRNTLLAVLATLERVEVTANNQSSKSP